MKKQTLLKKWGHLLAKRHGWRCYYCNAELIPYGHHDDNKYTANYKRDGKRTPRPPYRFATVDHKIPKSRGGNDDPKNFVLACLECNQAKDNLTDQEYRAKLRRQDDCI